MTKVKFFFEFDFSQRKKALCELCHQPFSQHFQPPADADWDRAAHWCPNPTGTGFCSRNFRRKKEVVITQMA